MSTDKITIQLHRGDCLEKMKQIPAGSVDLILTDPPYGTTQNKWDSVIPLESMWKELLRLGKSNAIYAFTASQPFSSMMVLSQPKLFKHEWVWIKNRGSNFANTVREPMKEHESVLIFSRGKWTYNKQMQERAESSKHMGGQKQRRNVVDSDNYKIKAQSEYTLTTLRVPSSWQKFNTQVGLHPTQKPVALLEYLIKTYSNEGDTVLDFTMGSGSTGVAAVRTNRNFIGIELDPRYYKVAKKRIYETQSPLF